MRGGCIILADRRAAGTSFAADDGLFAVVEARITMFHIPTVLGPSEIHGTGVFAATDIPSGTIIWTFNPEVDWEMTDAQFRSFPEPFRTKLLRYCYQDERTGLYVLCGDNAKFMNHRNEPNCDDSGRSTIANRDIRAGEELTCDYRSFDLLSRGSDARDARGELVFPASFPPADAALRAEGDNGRRRTTSAPRSRARTSR